MSRVCRYVEGECTRCIDEAIAEAAREIKSARGRWMVVLEDGATFRYRQLSSARKDVARNRSAGIGAVVRRWRRDRVCFNRSIVGFESCDSRWVPRQANRTSLVLQPLGDLRIVTRAWFSWFASESWRSVDGPGSAAGLDTDPPGPRGEG